MNQSLAAKLRAMPPGSLVPASWVAEQLEGDHTPATQASASGEGDLDCEGFGRLFRRSASTVRGWAEEGRIPGAYRLRGRAWRFPPAAIESFRKAETRQPEPASSPNTGGDLGDWRRGR